MELWKNNARSTLSSSITDTDTVLVLQSGYGVLFPEPSSPDYFFCTLDDGANIEIIKVLGRVGDVFTSIERAQQGTIAQAWNAGTKVENRLTQQSLEDIRIWDTTKIEGILEKQVELLDRIIFLLEGQA
jgi:hypothetical protein